MPSVDKSIVLSNNIITRRLNDWLGRSEIYHYTIVILMLMSAILGATIFNEIQVICELFLFVLLGYGITKIKLKREDLLLLTIFLIISFVSLFYNSFVAFALNFKIYGLCIMTLIYFRENKLNPEKIVRIVHIINAILILHQFIFGHFIIESAWFFEEYKEHVNERPVGLFLTPHASSFFIAVNIIYLLKAKEQYLKSFGFFILTLMTSSFTSTVALLAQVSQQFISYITSKIPLFRVKLGWPGKLAIVIVPIFLLSIYTSQFVEFLKFSSYTRYYSLEITLGQIFDSRYFSDIFKLYFRNYQEYIFGQERTFADVGNEIGLIKIVVEGGIVLGLFLLITLIRRLKYYSIFIFVSLLHYSFIINMPFMLFIMLYYNNQMTRMEFKKRQTNFNKGYNIAVKAM